MIMKKGMKSWIERKFKEWTGLASAEDTIIALRSENDRLKARNARLNSRLRKFKDNH